jgi:D-aspartate ligase
MDSRKCQTSTVTPAKPGDFSFLFKYERLREMKQLSSNQYQVPVVVVGMDAGGLGVTRSLAAHGVPVVAVDDNLQKPGMATRAAIRTVQMPIRSEQLIDRLLRLAQELGSKPVLIATLRLPLLLISEHRDLIAQAYHIVLPSHELVVAMEHKEHLLEIAAKAGVAYPRTVQLRSERALIEAAELRYPVILKPADNDLKYMKQFKKAYILENHPQVAQLAADIWPSYRDLVLQEWIRGHDDTLYFCLQYRNADGKTLASFVGRKLLSWPPGKGATAACTAAPANHRGEVERITDRMFDAVGLRGFGSVELKLDSVSGQFFLIEPTVGRTDQQEEVATLNGINIPHAAYCDQIGAPLPRQTQTTASHTWSNPLWTRWARQRLHAQNLRAPRLRIDNGRVFDAYFRPADPLPGLFNLLQQVPEPLALVRSCLRRRPVRIWRK